MFCPVGNRYAKSIITGCENSDRTINYYTLIMMKRLTMIAVALFATCGAAFAQQSKSDETLEFRPHWTVNVQGGVAHTRGEAPFKELLSPAAQLSTTYKFHHAMGVRLGLGGWQAKGSEVLADQIYRFNYAQVTADYVLDLAGAFGGFNHKRVVNPYLFAGVGAAFGFNNTEAEPFKETLVYYWDGAKFFAPIRAGLGIDFRLSELISIGLEGNANILSDKFNSKKAHNVDWQFNALAGIKFRLGDNTRPSSAYAAKVAAAEAAAAALAAEKAAAEKAEADRLAAEKAEADRLAAEKAAAEKAAAEKAAAERAAIAAANSDNIYFTIGSTVIRKDEGAKIERLAQWMKDHPDFNVTLIGYADKETGTAQGNVTLSENRAKVVKERLISLGIPESRVSAAFKGDTVQPFAENDKNRVVTCELE